MNRMNQKFCSTIRLMSLTGLAGMSLLGTGCVSYTNVPVPESAPAFESANHFQSIKVVKAALKTVIEDHPVDGGYLINLPAGTTPETFQKIASGLPGVPLMPTDEMRDQFETMSSYHIGRIWIRASDAKVDVIYPFIGMDGSVTDQNVTVWLSGGVRSWRVYRIQHWAPGTIPTPPMYVPIVEDARDWNHERSEESMQDAVEDQVQVEPQVFDDAEIEALQEDAVQAKPFEEGIREVPLNSGD